MKGRVYFATVCVAILVFTGFCILENPPIKSSNQYAINNYEYFKNAQDCININSATIEELCLLKGIGAAKAQKIIDFRNENGKFTHKEDLLLVKGITEKILIQFESLICI